MWFPGAPVERWMCSAHLYPSVRERQETPWDLQSLSELHWSAPDSVGHAVSKNKVKAIEMAEWVQALADNLSLILGIDLVERSGSHGFSSLHRTCTVALKNTQCTNKQINII